MTDVLTPEQRTRCMSRVKGKNTGPELKLRKLLWSMGLRYRLGSKLPGKPDLVFVTAKVAIFIDGCFWHGCLTHGEIPRTNKAFWTEKIHKNKVRDQQVNLQLVALGWTVVRCWEHEIKCDIGSCLRKITTALSQKEIYGAPVKAK
jgi:DNA mismatch endonuclease (patch repair protein)